MRERKRVNEEIEIDRRERESKDYGELYILVTLCFIYKSNVFRYFYHIMEYSFCIYVC